MSRNLSLAVLVLLGVIWGVNFLFMKIAVSVVPPLAVAGLRTMFGALPILAYALTRRVLAPSDWRALHHFTTMAVLANVGPYVCFVIGTQHLPSGVAGSISGAIPCITAALVPLIVPAERLTRAKLVGVAVGFLGVLAVSWGGAPHNGTQRAVDLIGVAAMLGGSVSYALAIAYARRFMSNLGMSPPKLAAYQTLIASMILLPFVRLHDLSTLIAHPAALASLAIGLGLLGTGLAFVMYYALIGRLGALTAASVYYIPPAVAMAMGATFLGESVGGIQLLGVGAIMVGIYYASRQPKPAT